MQIIPKTIKSFNYLLMARVIKFLLTESKVSGIKY